jgi:peroxiredoxin
MGLASKSAHFVHELLLFVSTTMPLNLGETVPNFEADTTAGKIKFHDFIGDSWTILFSHPSDYTPVCTTELGQVQKLIPEFQARGVKVCFSLRGPSLHTPL